MSSPPHDPLAARAAPGLTAPVGAGERIHVLDVLRGFALFGVLLANMVWWFSGYAGLEPEAAARVPMAALDPLVLELQSLFVASKFISIFSFLFGVGFAIQMRRARERGNEVLSLYVRRMLWLLLFGVAHMLLLWYGDILHLYAVFGLLLIAWISRSDRTLVGWGLAFATLVPVAVRAVLTGLPYLSGGELDPATAFVARWDAVAALRHAAYAHGSYAEVVRINLAEAWAWFATDDALRTGAESFGKFLLGFWAGRSGLILRTGEKRTEADRALFRRGVVWGLALGLAGQGIVLGVDHLPMLATWATDSWAADVVLELLWHVGVLAMAMFYVCGIILLFERPLWRGALYVCAPVGRMALTNYLAQSVVCVFLFYGWGLGWYGEVGPTVCVGLTVVVFLAQALASRWWLGRFRFGPAEWLWRCLTYGRMQPFRSPRTAAV